MKMDAVFRMNGQAESCVCGQRDIFSSFSPPPLASLSSSVPTSQKHKGHNGQVVVLKPVDRDAMGDSEARRKIEPQFIDVLKNIGSLYSNKAQHFHCEGLVDLKIIGI